MAEDFEVGSAPPEESSNRTFVFAAAAVGGLLVLSMICLGLYALVVAPRQQEARNAQATQIVIDNATMAAGQTATAAALNPTVYQGADAHAGAHGCTAYGNVGRGGGIADVRRRDDRSGHCHGDRPGDAGGGTGRWWRYADAHGAAQHGLRR